MDSFTRDDRGFSLIELVAVVAVSAVLAAVAIPQLFSMADSMRLGQATRELERELQNARLKAVSTNRPLRVRMNCPAAGFYRTVEFLGSAADNAATRCTQGTYPYPATNSDPFDNLPDLDGPIRTLYPGVTVSNVSFEFRPNGTAWTLDSAGAAVEIPLAGTSLTVTRQSKTKVITVNGLGKIAIQ